MNLFNYFSSIYFKLKDKFLGFFLKNVNKLNIWKYEKSFKKLIILITRFNVKVKFNW